MKSIIEKLKRTLSPAPKEAIIQMEYEEIFYKNDIIHLQKRNNSPKGAPVFGNTENKELENNIEDLLINLSPLKTRG